MKIYYTKEQLLELTQKYFKEQEDRIVKTSIKSRKELVGYYEILSCITTISIKEEIRLLGRVTTMTEDITKERLEEILNILLESEGYHITNMKYEEGIRSEWIGYGMSKHLENTAYFDGVTLEISKIRNRTRARVNSANNFRICY